MLRYIREWHSQEYYGTGFVKTFPPVKSKNLFAYGELKCLKVKGGIWHFQILALQRLFPSLYDPACIQLPQIIQIEKLRNVMLVTLSPPFF